MCCNVTSRSIIAPDHRQVYDANRTDAQRALAYLDQIAWRTIVGLAPVRHALESILKRSEYTSQ
jgi:hypothetical protein